MKAIVEYDGTSYAGFQRQSDLPSIQGALEAAVKAATGVHSRVTGAGRTDGGAHAFGQVVSFITSTRLDDCTLQRALNAHLARDIAIQSLESVDLNFDPRRHATEREYHYLVVNRPTPAPLWVNRAHNVRAALDLLAMRTAASHLVGTHDFAAFGAPSFAGGSTVREIFNLNIAREDDLVRFELSGSSFMQHMVRSLVGTLLEAGLGRIQPGEVAEILESRDRRRAAPPVPASGLYLMHVTYGPLADRRGFDA